MIQTTSRKHQSWSWDLCRMGRWSICLHLVLEIDKNDTEVAVSWRCSNPIFAFQLKYCWWKISCTTWDVKNPVNNGINYLSTGAGFQPSTVGPSLGVGRHLIFRNIKLHPWSWTVRPSKGTEKEVVLFQAWAILNFGGCNTPIYHVFPINRYNMFLSGAVSTTNEELLYARSLRWLKNGRSRRENRSTISAVPENFPLLLHYNPYRWYKWGHIKYSTSRSLSRVPAISLENDQIE